MYETHSNVARVDCSILLLLIWFLHNCCTVVGNGLDLTIASLTTLVSMVMSNLWPMITFISGYVNHLWNAMYLCFCHVQLQSSCLAAVSGYAIVTGEGEDYWQLLCEIAFTRLILRHVSTWKGGRVVLFWLHQKCWNFKQLELDLREKYASVTASASKIKMDSVKLFNLKCIGLHWYC